MDLLNHFNGISLAVIIVLSYCAVLKNTKRHQSVIKVPQNRHQITDPSKRFV
jgi:hypothetical protein